MTKSATVKAEKPQAHYSAPVESVDTPTGLSITYRDDLLNLSYSLHAARLHVVRANGRVQGELSITRQTADKTQYLFVPEGFDFHSGSYKEGIVRTMARRIPEIDWELVIDDVCRRAIEHQRRTAPHQQMQASQIITKEPEYLIFPYIAKNQPNILFGEKGSNKTTLVLQMCRYLASGKGMNPIFSGCKPGPCPILWLDFETDPDGYSYDLSRL